MTMTAKIAFFNDLVEVGGQQRWLITIDNYFSQKKALTTIQNASIGNCQYVRVKCIQELFEFTLKTKHNFDVKVPKLEKQM